MKKLSTILISDFNISNFQAYLKVDESLPQMDVCSVPFGQVIQCLVDKNHEVWNIQYDIAIIWTQPEAIINSYFNLLMYEEFDESLLINEVDKFVSLIEGLSDRVSTVFIPLWTKAVYLRGSGILSYKSRFGIDYVILKINERLSYKLSKSNNIHILDSQSWMQMAGKKAFNPKLWYMGKVPFSNEVFIEAVKDVKAAARAIYGVTKKLIIVDLDDTIWGGIVGDDGWQNLILGGHDSTGEAYLDFQKGLKYLKNRGIILAIVSKNEEEIALNAINSNTEMVLKQSDFSAFRINWKDKASNIIEIANELNLGLQSIVFIDDNPFERALVREALPDVFVPEWPKNPMLYYSELLSMSCFDVVFISNEDLMRNQMYSIEEKRSTLKSQMTSLDDWINSLEMKIKIEKVGISNIIRVGQLFNKTNQMNLATRRMSESELNSLCNKVNNFFYCINVEDKFGDYGLTGIIGLNKYENILFITDFILSCRVMGRKVEETMLNFVISQAESLGLSVVKAKYLPTSKNKPCLEFLRKQPFIENNFLFEMSISKRIELSSGIQVDYNI